MVIRRLAHSRLFWGAGILLAGLLLYLALGVFGVQTLFYDTEVNEDFAATPPVSEEQGPSQATESTPRDPVVVSSGRFHPVAHPGTGDAIVYRLEDSSHVLRLENLDIFNGPALYVYAVAAKDASDGETVLDAGFLNLGPLKGNKGNQTYELPAEFDPNKHRSISIWCQRFSVNFATAPLR
jgi:electron transfer DM13